MGAGGKSSGGGLARQEEIGEVALSPQKRERERLARREQYFQAIRLSLRKLWENIQNVNANSIGEIQWLLKEVNSVVGTSVAQHEIARLAQENELEPSDVDRMYSFLGFNKQNTVDDVESIQSTVDCSTAELLEIAQELAGSVSSIEIAEIDQQEDSNFPAFEEMSTDELQNTFQLIYQDLLSEFAVLEASIQN